MEWGAFFSNLPVFGWICICIFLITVCFCLYEFLLILKTKDVKFANVEIATKEQRELYQAEGKNTLDNQCANAHNLLKRLWIDIYEAGRKKFSIENSQELFLLEDIAHLIEGKLNYEVKNDLTRNHITEKSDIELARYSEAKAIGYYRAVEASLHQYNVQLPKYDLPLILSDISVEDYKKTFSDIYFSACKIAGGKLND